MELEEITGFIEAGKQEITEVYYYFVNTLYSFLTDAGITEQLVIVIMIFITPLTIFRLSKLCFEEKKIKAILVRFPFRILAYPSIAALTLIFALSIEVLIHLSINYPIHWSIVKTVWQPHWYNFALAAIIAISILQLSINYTIARHIEPIINQWLDKTSKRATETQGFTDVRNIKAHLPKSITGFAPENYFKEARKQNCMLLGYDEDQNLVMIPRKTWKESHVTAMGPPGSGKGVIAGVTLSQSISYGDSVFVFDPKNDGWLRHVLLKSCDEAKVPFVLVNLRRGMPPQINPITGADEYQLEELLTSAFSLGRKGETADFYRNSDRKGVRLLSKSGIDNIVELNDYAHDILGEFAKECPNLLSQLEELAEISSLQTQQGADIKDIIHSGGCVYFVGSTRDEPVLMLQKMLFTRLLQIVENRPEGGRHVTAFLDEAKYNLSAPAVHATGVVRESGMNIIFAYQSLSDLLFCGADLDGGAVQSTIIDTAGINWIYRTKDFKSAEWASQRTGNIRRSTELREVDVNEGGAELLSSKRQVSAEDAPHFDTNIIQHLPNGCALCITPDVATLAYTNHVQVEKRHIPITKAQIVSRRRFADELIPQGLCESQKAALEDIL